MEKDREAGVIKEREDEGAEKEMWGGTRALKGRVHGVGEGSGSYKGKRGNEGEGKRAYE